MASSRSNILRRLRIASLWIAGLMVGYLLVYGVLSLCGGYQRADIGSLHGVTMGYTWAPAGFYDATSGWRSVWVMGFYPLWYLDTCYVHKSR
jgi:hypothetical protein